MRITVFKVELHLKQSGKIFDTYEVTLLCMLQYGASRIKLSLALNNTQGKRVTGTESVVNLP